MRFPTAPAILLAFALTALMACSADASQGWMAPSGPDLSAASTGLPFRGSLNANETSEYQPANNSALVHIEGSGVASLLGRYTLVSDFVLDLETLTGTQHATLKAANGDVITATVQAQGIPNDDGVTLRTIETATITGGTGRFAGATGSYILQRVLVQETGISSGTFEGTINLKR